MRIAPLILVALLAAWGAAAAEDARTVQVDGSAELLATPDRATFRMGVEARADTVETARGEVAAAVRRFLEMTRSMDIPDERVSSAAAIVRPEYDWQPQTRERRLLGYRVTRQLVVELHDLDRLGELTEAALKLGVNQVDPPVLDTSRRAALERQALAEAALDARGRATALAEALGATLGPVRSLQATGSFRPPVPMARTMMVAEADSGADTYQAGQITIVGSVSATFDLIVP